MLMVILVASERLASLLTQVCLLTKSTAGVRPRPVLSRTCPVDRHLDLLTYWPRLGRLDQRARFEPFPRPAEAGHYDTPISKAIRCERTLLIDEVSSSCYLRTGP